MECEHTVKQQKQEENKIYYNIIKLKIENEFSFIVLRIETSCIFSSQSKVICSCFF